MTKNFGDVKHVKAEQVLSSNVKFGRNIECSNRSQEYKFKSSVEMEPFDNPIEDDVTEEVMLVVVEVQRCINTYFESTVELGPFLMETKLLKK